MSIVEEWLQEYGEKLKTGELQIAEMELCNVFESILSNESVILTSRIKSIKSLKEKIKRNKMDCDENRSKSIFDILEDNIGIRIVCKKKSDEVRVNRKLIMQVKQLSTENEIEFLEDLERQPGIQKNGHEIFRVKCKYKNKFRFELQIKSLSNLFWGEMEHPLVYKNNKYLIQNKYYKKEMESIHDELSIIDNKLEYMEEIMLNEDESSIVNEKKDIIKRMLYLNLREVFKEVQDDYLNNNHIYEGVTSYIFRHEKKKKAFAELSSEEHNNAVLLNAIEFLLNPSKSRFSFNQFSMDFIDNLNGEDETSKCVKDILKKPENGWWYFVVISALIQHNRTNKDFSTSTFLTESIYSEIEKCYEAMMFNIKVRLVANFNDLCELSTGEKNNLISIVVEELKCGILNYLAVAKDIGIVDDYIVLELNRYSLKLLTYLRDNTNSTSHIDLVRNKDHIDKIVRSCVRVICNFTNTKCNIKPYLLDLDASVLAITGMTLPLKENLLLLNKEVKAGDLLNYLNKKEGGKNE